MEGDRHRYDDPQALQMGRIDAVANAILQNIQHLLTLNSFPNALDCEKQKTYPETGQTLLPGAHARLPDEIEHLPIVVDVVAIVRDGERERNGRMGFSHVGGRLGTTRRRGVSVSAVVGAAPARARGNNTNQTPVSIYFPILMNNRTVFPISTPAVLAMNERLCPVSVCRPSIHTHRVEFAIMCP